MKDNQSIAPPALRPGDTIGIFAPAGPVRDRHRLEAGMRLLRDHGFLLKSVRPWQTSEDYLAAPDESRIKEFHALWADETVKALMAVRGGYGCLRIIGRLDMKLLRSQPKMLIGFSDLTVMLNTIYRQTGLITIHGPMLSTLSNSDKESVRSLLAVMSGQRPLYKVSKYVEVLRGGMAQGIVMGGNLATLAHLLGTPWEVDDDKIILVLEDTGEHMYRLDRLLTQLHHAGKLKKIAGLILGLFDPGHDNQLATIRLNEQVWQRVLELTTDTNFPIWGSFPFGHQTQNHALPIGMEAIMDSAACSLQYI